MCACWSAFVFYIVNGSKIPAAMQKDPWLLSKEIVSLEEREHGYLFLEDMRTHIHEAAFIYRRFMDPAHLFI